MTKPQGFSVTDRLWLVSVALRLQNYADQAMMLRESITLNGEESFDSAEWVRMNALAEMLRHAASAVRITADALAISVGE